MQITYQKKDGSIVQKLRNTMLPYKIGQTTSMGWKVLNIEYEYKNKFYSEYEYNVMIHNNKLACIKKKRAVELCVKEGKNFLYCFMTVLLFSFVKLIIGA